MWLAGLREHTDDAPDCKYPQGAYVESAADRPAESQTQAAVETLEIERKYEVSADAEFPDAQAFETIGFVQGAQETVYMVARYFDTSDGQLARANLAMRNRVGGSDEGWHLKEKGVEGTRELHWPLSAHIPAGLALELRERLGEAAATVRPIAELRTERRLVRLKDARGQESIELADDRVHAVELRDDGTRVDRAWREWEAEVMPGADPSLLDQIERALEAAGAETSPSSAKIARAMGSLVSSAQASGADPALVERLQSMDRSDRESARKLQL